METSRYYWRSAGTTRKHQIPLEAYRLETTCNVQIDLLRLVETIGKQQIPQIPQIPAKNYEHQKRLLETTSDCWRPAETSSDQQRPLETTGDKLRPVDTTGDQQKLFGGMQRPTETLRHNKGRWRGAETNGD